MVAFDDDNVPTLCSKPVDQSFQPSQQRLHPGPWLSSIPINDVTVQDHQLRVVYRSREMI